MQATNGQTDPGSVLWGKDWPRIKRENVLRKRYYLTLPITLSDWKKLRRWLDRKDLLEIGTDANQREILVLNTTRMNGTARSRELFGIPDKASQPRIPS